MKNKKFLTITTLFSLAVLLSLLPAANSGVAAGDAPAGGTVPYSGRLSDDAGQPVPDGEYAFSFAMYDAAGDGNLLWSETQTGIGLKGGAFSVLLGSTTPLPQEARIKEGWLAVSVRGPGEIDFTALTPRQLFNTAAQATPSSPAAGPSCPHDHWGETWTGGTSDVGLFVKNTHSEGAAIIGQANEFYAMGVEGWSYSGTGVYGESDTGRGVEGFVIDVGGAAISAANAAPTGTALEITQGAFKVQGAGVDTDTTVFIHQAKTGPGGNICPAYSEATVIDHVLTNDDPYAILIVTLNGGTLGAGVGPSQPYITVQYDANNVCGMGHKWLIFNNLSAMPNGTKFNVMVIKP